MAFPLRGEPRLPSQQKLLFVSHDGGLAGAQRALLTLLKGLAAEGFGLVLVIPREGELRARAEALGIQVVCSDIVHWAPCLAELDHRRPATQRRRVLAGLLGRARAIAALAVRHDADLIYTNTVTCVEGALAARLASLPHLWHVHEPVVGNDELLPLLPDLVYRLAIRALSDAVVVPSAALAGCYRSVGRRLHVVHNGIEMPPSLPRTDARAEVMRRLGIDGGQTLVATVGAIQPRKDHATLLDAAARVVRSHPGVHFIVVGTGAEPWMRALHDQITALGLVPHVTHVPRWDGAIGVLFAGVDITVIASTQESFGLTAAESLAVGTPVVSTRCGGPAEIVGDGIDGSLVPVGDPAALAAAIVRLAGDPATLAAFGKAGRAKARRLFTSAAYVGRIAEIVRRTIMRDDPRMKAEGAA